MRILFMGTGPFGVPTLDALFRSRHEVIGVVTQPDRPKGRGREVYVSAIKQAALDAGIDVQQPEQVRAEEFVASVRQIAPDAFVVVAFGQIIPKSLLDVPRYGSVNVHASLLPKYRGAAPIHYALFHGEPKTGVTTMLMDPGLDTGPMLLREEISIRPDDTTGTLEARLAEIGAPLLLRTLDGLEDGSITPEAQDDSLSTYAPSIKKEDCRIHWSTPATDIVNRVRGCAPRPGAFTSIEGLAVKVWQCQGDKLEGRSGPPGRILSVGSRGITVASGTGTVLLIEVQPECRKRMAGADFARGSRIVSGMSFDSD